tara:strand:+ start:1600 stop:2262 length:663 start_codon:yes stop_codon:yes gene_type:complete
LLGKKLLRNELPDGIQMPYFRSMKTQFAILLRFPTCLLALVSFLACSPETTGKVPPTSDAELIRLIAAHGSAVETTLENLPEIEKKMLAGAPSPLQAADAVLAEATPEQKANYISRLESVLNARAFLLEECSGLDNGVYQAAAEVPEMKKIADQALARTGMEPKGKTTYEVMSEMTSGQDAAMLTALAVTIAERDTETKEALRTKFREIAAKFKEQQSDN